MLRSAAGIAGPHRWRRGPCLLVLTYHRVLPEGHPDRESEQPGMLVSPELLAMHFEVLKEHFRRCTWTTGCGRPAGEPPPGRSVAVTFDDGWRDNYDHAFPVIKAAGMPVTLFLVTDMVGSRYRFWPNRLARCSSAGTPGYGHGSMSTPAAYGRPGIPVDAERASEATPAADRRGHRPLQGQRRCGHACLARPVEAVVPLRFRQTSGSGARPARLGRGAGNG
jgi:hypothetical protein